MFAAAIITFRLRASASTINPSRTGSSNCFHHSRSAVASAFAGSCSQAFGASTGGRW
jgi:hypothetical protein